MKLSKIFNELENHFKEEDVSIRSIIDLLGEKSHSLLIIFFVVGFIQPIPLVGISIVFGLVISFFGFFMIFGYKPWLPQKLLNVKISQKVGLKTVEISKKITVELEKWIRPRGQLYLKYRIFLGFAGVITLISGLLLSLPLPIPFSNGLPALTLLLIHLGHLEDDSNVVLLGYIAFSFTLLFFSGLLLLPDLF